LSRVGKEVFLRRQSNRRRQIDGARGDFSGAIRAA
jgi:hypothetical protein